MNRTGAGKARNSPGFEGDYAEEYTQESFKELRNLAFWASRTGPEFYLIGGWAAWYYHHGLGSRDIDVVFPDRSILELFLQTYYRRHGYESVTGLLEKRFRKHVEVEGKPIFVEIDAASMDEGPPFKEDPARKLPFSAMVKNHDVWDLGRGCVKVPVPELLVLMKVKAHRDRSWALEHEAVSPVEVAFLRGKIWMDEFDIRNIALRTADWTKVWKIAEKYRIQELAKDTLHALRIKTG